jgi:uncharacterized protein (TIGR02597 family)
MLLPTFGTRAGEQSDVVGFVRIDVPALSDGILSVPFVQPAVYLGEVSSVTDATLYVDSNLFSGQDYANAFYVRLISGTQTGLWSTVVTNTDNSLTLTNGFILTGVESGDQFALFPHQTLDSVYPASLVDVTFIASPNALNRKTVIYERDHETVGINKSSAAQYYYLNGWSGQVGWRKVGAPVTNDYGNTILAPDVNWIVRNTNSNDLPYVVSGCVYPATLGSTIYHYTNANDCYVTSGRPLIVSLDQLSLGGTPAFRTSPNPISLKDILYFYDNTAQGYNKSSSAQYYYTADQWRRIGGGTTNYGVSNVCEAAAGFTFRTSAGDVETNRWQQLPPF